jgi:hypothetical protein
MKNSKYILVIISMVIISLCIMGCAHQPLSAISNGPGFWNGLLHGFIAPVSFIVSLFTDFRIYEFPNSGRWYDFGFMIGIGGFSGGIFGASRKKRRPQP